MRARNWLALAFCSVRRVGRLIDRAPVARAAGKTEARLEERNEEKMGGLLENQRRPL